MHTLIVQGIEADISELSQLFSRYGSVEIVQSALDAVQLFIARLHEGIRYDLLVINHDVKTFANLEIIRTIRTSESEFFRCGSSTRIVFCSDYHQVKSSVESDYTKDSRLFYQVYPINRNFFAFLAEKITAEISFRAVASRSRKIHQVNIQA
jgi:hypothetical protein